MLRHPAGLGLERLAAVLAHELLVLGIGGVARVELRVRQHRQGEGRRERGLRLRLRLAGTASSSSSLLLLQPASNRLPPMGSKVAPMPARSRLRRVVLSAIGRSALCCAVMTGVWDGVLLPCFMNAT